MEGKIIAVWGSPHSGKTTFATKLATAIYSSFESTVITLYTDLETPVIPVLFPFDKNEDLGSVGYPLSKTEVEQGDIINNLVTVKDMQNFGFLGYKTGEMAAKILKGEADISTMKIEYAEPAFKYNPEMCEFFGLKAPEGYVPMDME